MEKKEKKVNLPVNNSINLTTALSIFITIDIILWIFIKKFIFNKKKRFSSSSSNSSTYSSNSNSSNSKFSSNFEEYLKKDSKNYTSTTTGATGGGGRTTTTRFDYQSIVSSILDRHYRILEMKKLSSDLPNEIEIKEAYRKICLKTHPDTFDSNDPEKKQAQNKFIEATKSYNYLIQYLKDGKERSY